MLELYLNTPLYNGLGNLMIIGIILGFVTMLIIGHERRHEKDRIHPWFGQYTINIPNLMSYIRFPLGLWMVIVFLLPPLHSKLGSLSFHLSFALICLFDFLDGKFARKWNAITEGGKSLDPAADKWVTFCLAIMAYGYAHLRWWALGIVFTREIISVIQRIRMQRKGEDVSAKWLGKVKTVIQFTVLYIILLRANVLSGTVLVDDLARRLPEGVILWGTLFMCFCTVISLFPFFKTFSYVNDYQQSQKEECKRAWYIFGIPNLFTIGNYVCGVTAVYFAMPEVQVDYRSFVILFWIFAAGVCDAIDGPLARKLKSFSDFGACLDSSVDLSTFGLASAAIIFLRFSAIGTGYTIWGLVLAVFYFTFVHLRLARFSTILAANTDKSKKSDFVGMPSPSGSAGVMIFFTFFNNPIILSIAIIFLSIVMYSKFDFISHSNSWKHPLYRYFLIPALLAGFTLLLVLIFQQPFVNAHTSRALIIYFRICAWILFIPWVVYMLDAIWRTFFKELFIKQN